MEEGKEFLRSFGDLLQFHQKKKEQDSAPAESTEAAAPPSPPRACDYQWSQQRFHG